MGVEQYYLKDERKIVDWPSSSFEFFCRILWKNPNELFNPTNICNQEYSARLSFGFDGEVKSFTDKQKLRIQHYETSCKRNVRGTSLSRKKGHTRSMNITKGKISLVKVVNQPCSKLVKCFKNIV